ncbi:efflux RND transporter permease subunit [Methylobacter sp.]|uniref:efflux RND transporter permease subunit n=1 Tax=Methylobacter sp. TaxID=2051955 RepID=UPI002FE2C036
MAAEVGSGLFFSLLVITVSFLPIITMQAQEGRLFSPLAFTKSYAMAAAAILTVTLMPVLMGYFVRGKIIPEQRNPINRYRRLRHASETKAGRTGHYTRRLHRHLVRPVRIHGTGRRTIAVGRAAYTGTDFCPVVLRVPQYHRTGHCDADHSV